jgi:hypothetical protein
MSQPASPELEHFIRTTLGCGCPAEVFQAVDQAHTNASLAAGVTQRLAVGNRLLIYLVRVVDAEGAPAQIPGWIAAGRQERDALGLNRLRLVLVADASAPQWITRIEQSFAAAACGDDRLHLHVIHPDQLAAAGREASRSV